jgi:nitrogen fixation NifU-like protein
MSSTNPKLLDHFQNPRNIGKIDNADGFARGENPVNGYITDMYIRIDNGRIEDVKYKTVGCVVTIASASALSEIVKGKCLDEIIDNINPFQTLMQAITEIIGEIPDKNWHCPPTAIQTLLAAISDYFRKNKDEGNLNKVEHILTDIKGYFNARIK